MARLLLRRDAVRDEVPDRGDQLVEQEADDADVDQGHDDVADARAIPGVPDEEADADAADQHLGRDDGEPAQADADAQAGEDVGHGGRQGNLPEHLPPRQPYDGGDVAIVLRDVPHADRGVDDDRPDRGDEDHEQGRRVGIAEARERQRQPGERRDGAQDLEDRVEAAHRPGALADQHAERDADHGRQAEADADAAQALGDLPEGALVDAAIVVERIDDEIPGVRHDLGGRRQPRAGLRAKELPYEQRHRDHDERRQDDLHGVAGDFTDA